MTIGELQAITKESNTQKIESVKSAKRHSGANLFRIILLEDEGLLLEINEVISKLEEDKGPYDDLKKQFLRNHKSLSIKELKQYIEQGNFGVLETSQPVSKSNANTHIQVAGECIKKVGSAIYEHLIIITLLIAGWTISAINESLDPTLFSAAYLLYGVYSLVWIIRIAGNLKKAGSLLMK